ncbi:MAG TPA: hypothetical protein VGV40_00980 [Solirubrobacteraceae bacterium]|nr:hypothetical protein [Solirubrobacteraceae bacterium]
MTVALPDVRSSEPSERGGGTMAWDFSTDSALDPRAPLRVSMLHDGIASR